MNTEFNQIRDAYHRNMFAADGNKQNILALYHALADVNIVNETEENLIHLAARMADAQGIRFLADAGLKPTTDKYGNTALHALATTKFDYNDPNLTAKATKVYDTARLLLELGINPKKKNDSNRVAYFEAGLLYLYSFIDALGDAGVKMDYTESDGKNLLHTICEKLYHRKSIPGALDAATKTVRVLLDKGGIDVEDKDIFETTPLTYAQRSEVKEIAAMISGDEGDTITGGMTIHEAVLNGDEVAVEELIKRGVDLNEISDKYNRTPLMLACEYARLPMVELLANGGADVNFRSGNGETAVFYLLSKAITNFSRLVNRDLKDIVMMLRSLVKHKLDLDAPVNADEDTALHVLCQAGYLADLNTKLAEELVEASADVNKPNQAGKTALMAFAQRGNEVKYNIGELLIDNNADVNYADRAGNTALMYAAANQDKMSAKKLVSLILDKDGSTLEKVNNAGQTAIDIAIANGNEAVVKQILA